MLALPSVFGGLLFPRVIMCALWWCWCELGKPGQLNGRVSAPVQWLAGRGGSRPRSSRAASCMAICRVVLASKARVISGKRGASPHCRRCNVTMCCCKQRPACVEQSGVRIYDPGAGRLHAVQLSGHAPCITTAMHSGHANAPSAPKSCPSPIMRRRSFTWVMCIDPTTDVSCAAVGR